MALSKTGRFLSKAEILGVGAFSPLPILECPKNFMEFFIFVRAGCVQPIVGGGGVCDSWGHFRGIVGTGACLCIRPHCQHVSRMKHIYVHAFLDILASLDPPCPGVMLIQQGSCGRRGILFATPTPTYKATKMNKNMAPKLSLPGFKAFGVMFCPDVCSYFCLACGGGGH